MSAGFDAQAYRASSLENWEEAAAGWRRRQDVMRAWGEPVSHALVQALDPQPGQALLELAAGLGETGMLAAELVAPVGRVTISDQAEQMLDGARERAAKLSLANVDFKVINGEWIDFPLASLDGVLCRYGYMLMADPAAALGETRRVLRPGGRVALAVWDELAANPWSAISSAELQERGLAPAAAPAGEFRPGPFALGSERRLRELLDDAGFTDATVQAIDMQRVHDSFDDFWEVSLDLSRSFHDTVLSRPQAEIDEIRASLERRLEPHRRPDGAIVLAGRTLVAAADA